VLSMRAAIPTPEPGPLTAMLTLGLTFMKFSAHTELKGVTVFDPMILNEPVSAETVDEGVVVPEGIVVVALLQPAKVRIITGISARGRNHFLIDLFKLFSPYLFLIVY
jgi:hypothetical protein